MTTMKVGIDSYCYHRFFGEVYPQQKRPDTTMTLEGLFDFPYLRVPEEKTLFRCINSETKHVFPVVLWH